MNTDFINSYYTFEEQVVVKAYKNTIDDYKEEFKAKNIEDVYKMFLVINNKKYSLGKYKALQIALFEFLYFNDGLKTLELFNFQLIDTPDDKQYFPPIYNKNLVVRNKLLAKRQKEQFLK